MSATPGPGTKRAHPRATSRLTTARIALTAPTVALAAALFVVRPPLGVLAGLALLLDAAAAFVPWRTPRRTRSGVSYWVETMTYVLPTAVVAAAAAFAAPELYDVPPPAWLAAGVGAGAVLVAASRINLRAVISGDIAFLSVPDKPSHAAARGTAMAAAPVGEEAAFRGVALPLGDPSAVLVALSGLAFVSRHHLVVGVERSSRREVAVEILATVLFTGLALGGQSVLPSIVAHTVANAPKCIVEMQRAVASRR